MVDGGAYDPDKAYKDSKLCNMMFMAEAARRLEAKGIVVNAFSPGLIADPNGFFRNQNQLFAKVCPHQYCPALPCPALLCILKCPSNHHWWRCVGTHVHPRPHARVQSFNQITKVAGVAESNEFGGSALAYLAVDPSLDGLTGKWFDTLPPGKHQLAVHPPSEEARRVPSQQRLWALSSQLVGLA
jgi:protochlorophyllide reductase